MFSSGNEVT